MAKGNPKKEANERTKVVVRHLPPSLSRSELFSHFDHLFSDRYNWVSFRPGKSSRNSQNQRHSRAYIDFKSPGDVMEFAQFFNGHRFVNEKGAQCCAVVEYAPSQRVPNPCAKDSREATFLRDPHYLEFLKLIAKPVECRVHSSEFRFERKDAEEAESSKDSIVVTPLMDFIRKKRAAETGTSQYSSKVRPKKPSRKDKVLVNEASGLKAKPSSSGQKEALRVRDSAKRLTKTADSEKKETLHDKERKQKSLPNHGLEASERMIKHVLLSRESRLKKPLTDVYPQEMDHHGRAEDEKIRSTNCSPPKTPPLVASDSDQRRNAFDTRFMKKDKAEKSSRHRRKMDKPARSDQQHTKKECDESHQLPAEGATKQFAHHEAAKNTKNDSSSRKAKGKPPRKGAAAGNPDSEKQVWIPKSTAAAS
ncbi:Regulator of nonsense transcripts UPF3 [Linum grandiflorum]